MDDTNTNTEQQFVVTVPDKKLYFSIHSGEFYYVNEDEVATLDIFQIPLKSKPKNNCRKCYGRFHTGFNLSTKHYVLCNSCVRKFIDKEAFVANNVRNIKNGNQQPPKSR